MISKLRLADDDPHSVVCPECDGIGHISKGKHYWRQQAEERRQEEKRRRDFGTRILACLIVSGFLATVAFWGVLAFGGRFAMAFFVSLLVFGPMFLTLLVIDHRYERKRRAS